MEGRFGGESYSVVTIIDKDDIVQYKTVIHRIVVFNASLF